jgi:hypothetical protein
MARITTVIAAALALAVTLPAVPANAQTAIRTYVSITGNDTNPCSLTAPCRHFQAAVNATSLGGEVDALDPGGYGAVTLSQAVTIEGQGWSYVAPSEGFAIAINADTSDSISIHGVSLNGVGTTNATGIQFNSGGALHVRDCIFRNFQYGISFIPGNSGTLSVSYTLITDGGIAGNAIDIEEIGSGTVNAVLDHVDVENSQGDGIDILSISGPVNVNIDDSTIANSADDGLYVSAAPGHPVNVVVRNSTIANNGTQQGPNAIGFAATGSGAQAWVTRSTITGNPIGLYAFSSAAIYSYGDNNFVNNGSSNRASSTVQYQ